MTQKTITVKGMACDGCVSSVQKSLEGVDGVSKANVDLKGESAEVTFDENRASVKQLLAAVREAGYEPQAQA